MSLGFPDMHHLTAASGWLELGNATEAELELARLSAAKQKCPEALEMRWQIHATRKDWAMALGTAELLVQTAPDKETSWLHRAYAQRRAPGGGLQQAWDVLRPAFEKFPQVSIIPYNLACYAAQLGRLEEAWDWLQKSMAVAEDLQAFKSMALADSDLELLWEKIRSL